jgi:aspartate racemase
MKREKIIGIVGGVGPYAGIDLAKKIFDQTQATIDQDHLPVIIVSFPAEVGDRTAFLSGQTTINPAYGIAKIIKNLYQGGADIIGIACNTAHVPPIFNVITDEIKRENLDIRLIHIIDEVVKFIRDNSPKINDVGILGTMGTYKSDIYQTVFKRENIRAILPDEKHERILHDAIYSPIIGIKAQSNPVSEATKSKLMEAINHLKKKGAEAVVLGCTELPLAITEQTINGTIVIDPTVILARALIREVSPNKLKPFA